MPKKLKVSPNERVDIPDFVRAANDYTAEVSAFNAQKVLLGDRGHLLEGFRVQIINDPGNPAEIIVYNGNALNPDGTHLHNEADPAYAQQVTLTGAGVTFYVEIIFIEQDSDEDSRAFWDPTVANVPPIPNGREFDGPTVTRLTPTWRVVTPVSTLGFDFSISNPGSLRIPLMRLKTSPTNTIDPGVDNPGLATAFPATVTTEDISAALTSTLKVADARLFSASAASNLIEIDPGGIVAVTPANVASIDYEHNILNLVAPITGNAYPAGTVVRATGSNSNYVVERVDGLIPVDPSTHPDNASRLFQGSEIRGSGLAVSKEDGLARDDLNIKNLKDQIDFLAAQIREMKWGALRVGDDNIEDTRLPPLSFDLDNEPLRYFSKSRGIQGAGTHVLTVGDGVTSYGDYNASDGSAIKAAVDAASPGDTIFIKRGLYTVTANITVDKALRFVGDGPGTVITAADPGITLFVCTTAQTVRFHALQMLCLNTINTCISIEDDLTIDLVVDDCIVGGSITTGPSGTLNYFRVSHCLLIGTVDNKVMLGRGGSVCSANRVEIQDLQILTFGEDNTILRLEQIQILDWSQVFWQPADINAGSNSVAIQLINLNSIASGKVLNTHIISNGTICPRLITTESMGDGVDTLVIDGVYLVGTGNTLGQLSPSDGAIIKIDGYVNLTIKNVFTADPIKSSGSTDSIRGIFLGQGFSSPGGRLHVALIENCYILWDPILNGVGIQVGDRSNITLESLSTTIRDCFVEAAVRGIALEHQGRVLIDNCWVEGEFPTTRAEYGIILSCSSANDDQLDVVIRDCFIRNIKYTNSLEVAGIKVHNPNGFTNNMVNLKVVGTTVQGIGSAASILTTSASGVLMAANTAFVRLSVLNSDFFDIACSGVGLSSGVLLYGYQDPNDSAVLSGGITIENNHFSKIGANGNLIHGVGINLGVGTAIARNVLIERNLFSVLESSGLSNFGIAVRQPTGSVRVCKISNNILFQVGTLPFSTTGAQISVEAANLDALDICNNTSREGETGAGILVILLEAATGGYANGINVCNNSIIRTQNIILGLILFGIGGTTPGTFSTWDSVAIMGNDISLDQSITTGGQQHLIQIVGFMLDVRVVGNRTRAESSINPAVGHLLLQGVTDGESRRVTVSGNTGLTADAPTSVVPVVFDNIQDFSISGNAWDFGTGILGYLLEFLNFCGNGAISGNYFGGYPADPTPDVINFGSSCFGIFGSGNTFEASTPEILGTSVVDDIVFEVSSAASVGNTPLNMSQ